MTPSRSSTLPLFGGPTSPWSASDWTASDDRVRGGQSRSHLRFDSETGKACFFGDLDFDTLGGAGFASQRTTAPDLHFDLSDYDGILLELGTIDHKEYTLIIKDDTLPPAKDGREQASISWESTFSLNRDGKTATGLFFPWRDFKPTYRGKAREDAPPLDLTNIKRFSFMVRSFFGSQKGKFCMEINSVSAYKEASPGTLAVGSQPPPYPYRDEPDQLLTYASQVDEKAVWMQPTAPVSNIRKCFCCL